MATELYFETKQEEQKYRRKQTIRFVLLYTLLVFFALFMMMPFYWMINVSLWNDRALILSNVYGASFWPRSISFDNYINIFTDERYRQIFVFMIYTLINGVFSTFLSIFVTVLAAFAFARLNFKGKEILFALFLATMMIPGEMMIISNFTTVATLGWLGTFTALIVPGLGSVFYMFFLRQTFRQIPDELYYAAKVDGNTDFRYLTKVMLPIAKPALITVTILSLIGSWNSFIWPRTVNRVHMLVTEGIMHLFQDEAADTSNQVMAAAVLVSAPLLITFLLFRKYIMRGVSRAGIKG